MFITVFHRRPTKSMELRAPWKISGVKVRKNDKYFITILKK